MPRIIVVLSLLLCLGVCEGFADSRIKLKVDDTVLAVEWEDNESVNALKSLAPLTVKMSRYGGFEQVGALGRRLPREDERITTRAGDIVLYSGNQIVVFYGSNTWEYTRLGRITGMTQKELEELLGKSGVTLTISAE